MNSMQDDYSVGGNNLILVRNLTNYDTREYYLAFAGFCKGVSCNWEERLATALHKFPPKVHYLGSRSTFLEFGIVG